MLPTEFSLSLGGGGARGLAHIGVMKWLEESHAFPRAISGTSMGAIIGSLIALGKTSKDMQEILENMQWLSLIDFDLKKGLIKGEKIEKFLDKLFEGKTFSDTKIPLYITSTDINTGKQVLFTSGKLSLAVRASIGIPGIISPKHDGPSDLVDGGLTSNLPIEALPPGVVIAVSAMRDIERKMRYKKRVFSFEWQNTLFGNSYSILQKTIDIMLSQNEARSIVSRPGVIYIRPKFDNLDYYEFHKHKEFIQSGYEATKGLLSDEGNS